ncbi:MAG: hypothetical protein RBS39_10820 [Phycisphaerales bacterium]|jgi:hypothetical protein|nr:hypothetical protein [Phycisphaerales bacterium]
MASEQDEVREYPKDVTALSTDSGVVPLHRCDGTYVVALAVVMMLQSPCIYYAFNTDFTLRPGRWLGASAFATAVFALLDLLAIGYLALTPRRKRISAFAFFPILVAVTFLTAVSAPAVFVELYALFGGE